MMESTTRQLLDAGRALTQALAPLRFPPPVAHVYNPLLRFGSAEAFFENWFVLNYCPLVFLEASGRNLTPDRLPVEHRRALTAACDRHLAAALAALQPSWVLGVGGYAERRLRAVLGSNLLEGVRARSTRVGQILHPSPASPAANRGWSDAVDRALAKLGLSVPKRPVHLGGRTPNSAKLPY